MDTKLIPIAQVREELNAIRYYYARREMFEDASREVGESGILSVIARYNRAVCMASPKLYELYFCIYIKSNTQEAAAEALNYSLDYVQKQNKRLLKFFQQNLGDVA